MNRENNNNNNFTPASRGGRRGGQGARPDSGRGNIVSSNHAQERRRRRDNGRNVGGGQSPTMARSLVDRITVDRGAQRGRGRRGARARRTPAARTPTQEGGASGAARNRGRGNMGPVGTQPNARPLAERITGGPGGSINGTQAVAHNGFGSARNNQASSSMALSQPPQVPMTNNNPSQMTDEFMDELFDELLNEPIAPPANLFSLVDSSSDESAKKTPKPRPARVAKNLVDRIENKKLRALLGGRKERVYKMDNLPILRMGHTAKGLEGHELVCASPDYVHDDEM
ncbi:hypothetical protein BU23DRAFT_660794 [Bimuria novae-zelandiae CBS 107.79]|uniref:Uncharacterized protein n=1 Tax=Bimuria novae-zelandiae CBS 107.79 TaxID=1447943 RepID=A0A6A5UQZ5_9PLEO|nr:hypothetical protein BU23DRAFT_660794 [Bimuria novae-zelandiae CBS 107.79]